MPIFEFDCRECHKKFELLVRGTNGDHKCPTCGSVNIKKRFSTFAARSTTDGGTTTSVGSSCGSCSSGSCSTCN